MSNTDFAPVTGTAWDVGATASTYCGYDVDNISTTTVGVLCVTAADAAYDSNYVQVAIFGGN